MPHAEVNGERRTDQPAETSKDNAEADEGGANLGGTILSDTPTASTSGLTHRLSGVTRPDPADQVWQRPSGKLKPMFWHHVQPQTSSLYSLSGQMKPRMKLYYCCPHQRQGRSPCRAWTYQFL